MDDERLPRSLLVTHEHLEHNGAEAVGGDLFG
jgi:hypothetical protein